MKVLAESFAADVAYHLLTQEPYCIHVVCNMASIMFCMLHEGCRTHIVMFCMMHACCYTYVNICCINFDRGTLQIDITAKEVSIMIIYYYYYDYCCR